MAVQEWVTCDICNPKGELRRQVLSEGQGVFEGPRDAAIDGGWEYRHLNKGTQLSYDKKDICPDCKRL